MRTKDGTLAIFDAPGAVSGTYLAGIDEQGNIGGYYCDASGLCHGFLRSAAGTFTTFDAPGAVAGTYETSVGLEGVLAGYYWDAQYIGRGFVRSTSGKIATFEVPGAAYGTYPLTAGIGGVAGAYQDTTFATQSSPARMAQLRLPILPAGWRFRPFPIPSEPASLLTRPERLPDSTSRPSPAIPMAAITEASCAPPTAASLHSMPAARLPAACGRFPTA